MHRSLRLRPSHERFQLRRQRRFERQRGSPVTRMAEARARARAGTCASAPALRSALVELEVAVLVVAGDRVPGCARCTRIWCVRPVFSSASSRLNRRLARSLPSRGDRRLAAFRCTARAARRAVTYLCEATRAISQVSPGRNALDEREVDLLRPRPRAAARAARSARCASWPTSSTPEVSRSSRWTSSRNLRLRPLGAQLLDHAEADAAAAVHRHAGGLVDRRAARRPRARSAGRAAARRPAVSARGHPHRRDAQPVADLAAGSRA